MKTLILLLTIFLCSCDAPPTTHFTNEEIDLIMTVYEVGYYAGANAILEGKDFYKQLGIDSLKAYSILIRYQQSESEALSKRINR